MTSMRYVVLVYCAVLYFFNDSSYLTLKCKQYLKKIVNKKNTKNYLTIFRGMFFIEFSQKWFLVFCCYINMITLEYIILIALVYHISTATTNILYW